MKKYSISHHKRIKEKPSIKNKKTITELDRKYLDYFANSNKACFVCETLNGVQGHHIKKFSSDKKIHSKMIPLCIEHHVGSTLSPHGTPKLFKEKFNFTFQEEVAKMHYDKFLNEML